MTRLLYQYRACHAEKAELIRVLRGCAAKLKAEYDRQQPDAAPDECWAEAETAFDVLRDYPEGDDT
jgi:hypothetical protein